VPTLKALPFRPTKTFAYPFLGTFRYHDTKIQLRQALRSSCFLFIPVTVVGQGQVDAFMLVVERLGGQPVTMLKEDVQPEPEIAGRILPKFIDMNKVNGIVGLNF
jgi:uncharacterized protein (DUF2126 family)